MPALKLNEGSQRNFVQTDKKYAAYIGGLGSGKTWAGIARGLRYALQERPKGVFHAPHGVIAAATYPSLKDVIIPKLQEVMYLTGLADWEKDYRSAERELRLRNGAIIRLRSLDSPNWMRGPEYTWFFIDEGRNVSRESWKILTGRLRQQGYKRSGFVASTPNGFDWMYDLFHPESESEDKLKPDQSEWFPATSMDNPYLDDDYLDTLRANYSGRFYDQEILGQFVGIVEGGVFPDWDPRAYCVDLDFDPELPLYTGWDFGIGDPGVEVWLQVKWVAKEVRPDVFKQVPQLRILDAHSAQDWTSSDWAEHHKLVRTDRFGGRDIRASFGDPAGMARNGVSGTSVIEDLNARGVEVSPARKRAQDYSIRILNNMMADGRVLVDKKHAKRVSDAFSSHKWSIKDDVRIGVNPVHDWTSHYVDAVRYPVSMLLSLGGARDIDAAADGGESYNPTQYGWVFDQLDEEPEQWLGQSGRRRVRDFAPTIRPRS